MTKRAKADAWMPFYVSDYLGDTTHLTTEQHGAYLLLLFACWKRGGVLPNDSGQLAAMAKLSMASWKKHAPVLLDFFSENGDVLEHGRVREEAEKAIALSEKRREAGANGGRPRKPRAANGQPIAAAKENQLVLQLQSQNGSQTETPTRVALPSPSPPPTEVSSVEDKSSTALVDPSAAAWALVRALLAERTGANEKQAASFFGGLLAKHKLEARELLPSLTQAQVNETRDPRSYLVKAAEALAKRRDERIDAAKPKRVSFV